MNRSDQGRFGWRPVRQGCRTGGAALGLGLLLGSCVTTYEDAPLVASDLETPELAVSQTIPLGNPPNSEAQRPVFELYNGVLRRLEQAVAERDLDEVQRLLDGYERTNLPDWVRDRLRGYRAISHGLAFQRHAAQASTLQLVAAGGDGVAAAPAVTLAAPPPIGEPLRLEFALPAAAAATRLGGATDDDPIGFGVALTVEDLYIDGGTGSQKRQSFVWVPATFDLAGSVVLRLPIGLELPAGDSVQRSVHVRVDLMPGYVQTAGWRAPVQRTTLTAASFTQWPRGYESIAKAPLPTLREAIRLGDEGHFQHVFLAALFSAGADRETAIGLLVDQVRLGTQAQAIVAMAALRTVTGVKQSVVDREGWLAWWQLRQAPADHRQKTAR